MQWFIDTIYALAKNYIDAYLATHPSLGFFVDRGDPLAWDFTVGDFTDDNAWHDLDLSSIVPAGATSVLVKVNLESLQIEKKFELRRKDNASGYNTLAIWTQFSNVRIGGVFLVPCNANRVIQYLANPATWSLINVNVNGWFLDSEQTVGFINRGDPGSPDFGWSSWGQGFTWYVKDLSSIVPAATSAVLLHVLIRSTSDNKLFSLRTLGNTGHDNVSSCRTYDLGIIYEYDIVVPTAGEQSIEYQLATANYLNVDVTVKGWWF